MLSEVCINWQALLTFECVEDSLLEILVVGNSSVQEGLQGKQGYKWYPSCLDS